MKAVLKSPEVQFFLIIFSTLLAVFFINRTQLLEPEFLYLNGVFFLVLFFVSFLQMLYGLYVRTKTFSPHGRPSDAHAGDGGYVDARRA